MKSKRAGMFRVADFQHGRSTHVYYWRKIKNFDQGIFAEEFKRQEKNIINIISGNFEITIPEIKDIKTEVSDLKNSLEFTEDIIEKR